MAVATGLCRVRFLIKNDFTRILKYSTLVNSVSLNSCVHVRRIRNCRRFNTTSLGLTEKTKKASSSSSSSSDSDHSDQEDDDVSVEYVRGLPQVTVPLPSRRERCRFTLRPISNTVGDLLQMLHNEDKGIDRAVISTVDGTRIASSTSIETLMQDDFRLTINDTTYNVNTPKQERLTQEEETKLSDIKELVSQLYEALHVQEHQLHKERELYTRLETLQTELQPLEEKRNQIELVAVRKSNWMAWAGLGLMSVQFGILARLTWWEYSWDIMEPVTYFVTYGTAMAAYAYFVLTKEEYVLTDVKDRQHLLTFHKKAKKLGLDLNQYNQLRDQITKVELDLKKLRNPLRLRLPPTATAPKEEAPTTPPEQKPPSSKE